MTHVEKIPVGLSNFTNFRVLDHDYPTQVTKDLLLTRSIGPRNALSLGEAGGVKKFRRLAAGDGCGDGVLPTLIAPR